MDTTTEAISFAHRNFGDSENEKLVLRDSFTLDGDIKIPFLEHMENKMFPDNDFDNDVKQFVLTGSPSAGKTTELNRIARHLKENIGDRKNSIIHLFSLQNASSSQASLDSAEDLWQWIIRSHKSHKWSESRYTLDEFIEENKKFNLQPILLIDTVDLLIYGADPEETKRITSYWQEIISTIKAATVYLPQKWTVLWSCRSYEWAVLTAKIKGLEEIKLPGLAYEEVAKRFNYKTDDKYEKDGEEAFLTALGCVFPIVAGHKKNLHEWSPILREKYKVMHDRARNSPISNDDIRKNAAPLPWIIKNLSSSENAPIIGIDPLYEGLIDQMCHGISRISNTLKADLIELWQNEIETEFWEAAYAPNTHNSRIHITHDSIMSDETNDGKLLQYLIDAALNEGLLRTNSRSGTYEMKHQLFAEYCIWKVSKREKRHDEPWLDNFPSCKMRKYESVDDDGPKNAELIKEAKKWFLPFYVFNENIAHKILDEDYDYFSSEWKECIFDANKVFNIVSGSVNKITIDLSDPRYINDEKREVLARINDFTPLLVNGPPGVGKSHLSYVWIDKKASGNSWVELQPGKERTDSNSFSIKQKPKAHFMTLSRRLVKQINRKINEYYDKSNRPAEFTSWSIPVYIEQMRKMLNIKISDDLTFDIFSKELKKQRVAQGWNKVSAEELWDEFQNNYIDQFGERKTIDQYDKAATRSGLFEFTSDPGQEAESFAKWANKVGDGKKSLSEKAGECIKKVMDILFDGDVDDREAIRAMQSEILVLDEIQDLPSPVIFLLLLMHNGPTGSVMMCGDDEQTLELTEFKWKKTFQKISSAFFDYNKLHKDSPLYESNGIILKKWDQTKINNLTKKIEYLVVVERSVPPIVECVSEAWNNGVSSKIPGINRRDGEERGTGCIKAGLISENRAMENKENNIEDGVEIHNNWTWELLVAEAQRVYDGGEDVAFLFPDEGLWRKFSKKLEEKNIFMDLWTPRLIKGLEYPVVIAICPWDISTKSIDDIILGKVEWKNWNDIESYVEKHTSNNTQSVKIKSMTKLAKQKKRHINVMLSRSQNLLRIVNINNVAGNKEQEYFTSQFPVTLEKGLPGITILEKPKAEKKGPSISDEELAKLLPGLERYKDKKKQDELIDSRINTQALIRRLREIILSADSDADRLQIQLKASHLSHYLQQMQTGNGSKTGDLEFPFRLLSVVLKDKDSKSGGLFDNGWKHYKKITGEIFSDKLDTFEEYVTLFAKKCRMIDGNNNKLSIPVLELQTFNKKINEYINLFTSISNDCFVHDVENPASLSKDGEEIQSEVQKELLRSVFGEERLIELDVKQWITTAKGIDLKTYMTEIDYTTANYEISVM